MFGSEAQHPNTSLDVFLSNVALHYKACFFCKTHASFQLAANWWSVFYLSQQKNSWCSLSSQTTTKLPTSPHSIEYPRLFRTEVCTSVSSCTYFSIPISVPLVCSTGSLDLWKTEMVHRWQVPFWFLPQQSYGWWLTAISGPGNIMDNPDQFFPPAGAEWGAFSQDRRRALIGSLPVIVIMWSSHCSLLWLGEPQLNLHLIRLLHGGWHRSWRKAWEVPGLLWTTQTTWPWTQGLGWCLTGTTPLDTTTHCTSLCHSYIQLNSASYDDGELSKS